MRPFTARNKLLILCLYSPSHGFNKSVSASLNKSERLASVLFTHLSVQLSISLPLLHPCRPPFAQSQKTQTPTVDSAHVRGLIWITVPWWRGMLRLRLGECVAMRRVRGRLKSPDPEKESRWQWELPHLWTAPVPPVHPFLGSHSTSVQKSPWELWSGRMSQCWACTRSIRSQGACWLLCNAEHKNLADTILVYDPLCPIVALQQTCDW